MAATAGQAGGEPRRSDGHPTDGHPTDGHPTDGRPSGGRRSGGRDGRARAREQRTPSAGPPPAGAGTLAQTVAEMLASLALVNLILPRHPQTLALMESEYVYPRVGHRASPDEWEADGAPSIRERARARAKEVLDTHFPTYIDPRVDADLRARFPMQLPAEDMRPRRAARQERQTA